MAMSAEVRRRKIQTGNVERPTPRWLFDTLHAEFRFDMDVCATPENTLVDRWLGRQANGSFLDGLDRRHPWGDRNWCNPPYARGSLTKWCERAASEAHDHGHLTVMLLPVDPSTKWFAYCEGREIRLVRKRLRFGGTEAGASFASMLVIFRPVSPHWIVVR